MVVNFPPTTPGEPGYSLIHTEPNGVTWEYDGEKWRVTGGNAAGGGGGYTDDDVDNHLNVSGAEEDQVLSWDGSDYVWVDQSAGGGTDVPTIVSDVAPATREDGSALAQGDLWWNSLTGRLYVYYMDGNTNQWVEASPAGEGGGGDGITQGQADALYLSKVNDDTAAGAITFQGQTTHENGVSVTGGAVNVPDGSVYAGGNPVGGSANGARLINSGIVSVSRSESSSPLFNAYTTGTADPVISMYNDGRAVFGGLTTHENGVRVSGGSLNDVYTGFYVSGGDLITTNRQFRVAQFGNSDRSVGISCNPNDKMSNTEGLSISLIESTYGYGSHGVQELSLFRGAYTANTNCKGSTNCYTAEFKVNQTGADNRAVGFYSKVDSGDSLNGTAYGIYAEGSAPNYFNGEIYHASSPTTDANFVQISSSHLLFSKKTSNTTSHFCARFIRERSDGGALNTERFIEFRDGDNALVGSIRSDGSGSADFIPGSSDYRTKENIVDLPSAIDAVKSLRPVNFNFKWAPGATRPGFIAHELAEVVPSAVLGEKDAVRTVGTYTDVDGNVETEVEEPEAIPFGATWEQTGVEDDYQSIDAKKLIPVLTKALQEALEKIDTLEGRIDTLEGN